MSSCLETSPRPKPGASQMLLSLAMSLLLSACGGGAETAVDPEIAASAYAQLFRQEFGNTIFANTDAAFNAIGLAIAAFERTRLQPFSSK